MYWTENATIAVVQPVLRHSGDDSFAGGASHRYGKSTANQVWQIMQQLSYMNYYKHCMIL